MALSFTFVKHLAHLKDNNIAVKINQILVSGQQLRLYVTAENPFWYLIFNLFSYENKTNVITLPVLISAK